MTTKILRLPDVKALTGLSRSTIYLKVSKGEFPEPIKISSRAIGWPEEDIENWLDTKIIESRLGQPCDER
jgi:prophage regulatory protein